jgi:hypothetical protein
MQSEIENTPKVASSTAASMLSPPDVVSAWCTPSQPPPSPLTFNGNPRDAAPVNILAASAAPLSARCSASSAAVTWAARSFASRCCAVTRRKHRSNLPFSKALQWIKLLA